MNCTERFFLDVIKSFITSQEVKAPTEKIELKELYDLAKRHSLQGVVYYVLNRQKLFNGENLMEALLGDYEKTVSYMALRRTRGEILSMELSGKHIPHIEFKGSAVADFYPIPELRTYSDVDMIIKNSDRERLRSFMTDKGFKHSVADGGVVNCYAKGYELYEMHTALNLPKSEEVLTENLWEHTVSHNGEAFRFEDNFHLAYLVSHMEKHMKSGGAGVKMYMDIALYVRNCENIDLDKVNAILAKAGLQKYFSTVLCLCHEWFDTFLPDFVTPIDDSLLEKLTNVTLTGGVYGDHTEEGVIESALTARVSSGRKGAKLRFILSRIFPAKTELWRLYPKFEGKPLLLPLAWLCHLGNFFTKGKFKKVKSITHADVQEAQSRFDFLTDIGCK
ncbi:MAG: nucleotidyltransferase family protein [Eubacteriales bacterium]|nr:nucleotidyltransferase family protein [Eubacteriales bacterium]